MLQNPSTPQNTCKNITVWGIKGAIGAFAIVSAFLYLKPSQTCAKNVDCGLWLTEKTSEDTAAWLFFSSGALDYALMNIYFAWCSVDRLRAFITRQETIRAMFLCAIGILAFTAIEGLQPLFISLGNNAENWETALAVAGAFPSILFTCIKLIEEDVPYRYAQAKQLAERENKKYASLRKRIYENWLRLLSNPSVNILPSFLFEKPAKIFTQSTPPEKTCWSTLSSILSKYCSYLIQKMTELAGLITSIAMLLILKNTYAQITRLLHIHIAFRILLTACVSLKDAYLVPKIIVGGFSSTLNIIKSACTGKTADSVPLKMYPKSTVLVALISLATAALSYAVVVMTFLKNFDIENKGSWKWGPLVAIDSFHLFGLMHLWHLILSYATKDPVAQILFDKEKEKNRLLMLSPEKLDEAREDAEYEPVESRLTIASNMNLQEKSKSQWQCWPCTWFCPEQGEGVIHSQTQANGVAYQTL